MQEAQEMRVWSLGQEDPLEEEMITHSSIPGEFHGQRSLADYSTWVHEKVGHDLETKQQQQQITRLAPK